MHLSAGPDTRSGPDERALDHRRRVDLGGGMRCPRPDATRPSEQVEVAPAGTAGACRCRASSRRSTSRRACRRRPSPGTPRARSTPCRPSAMRSSTEGSSTYVPALMRFVGASSRGGFSMNAIDAALVVGGHDAEHRRILDRRQVRSSPRRPSRRGTPRAASTSRSVSTSPFTTMNVLVDAAVVAPRTGSRPRCRAARARPRSAAARRRTCSSGNASMNASGRYPSESTASSTPCRPRWPTTHSIIGRSTDRQHLLRGGERQRSQPGAEAPDEDDRPHEPVVAAALLADVAGAEVAGAVPPAAVVAGDEAGGTAVELTSGVPGRLGDVGELVELADARRLLDLGAVGHERERHQHRGRCRSGSCRSPA